MAASLEKSVNDILKRLFDLTDWPQTLVTITISGGLVIFLCYAIYLAFELIQGFRLYVLSRCCFMKVNLVEKYGRWAVISGGALGIGRSMARELAKRGMSILIIDKNAEALAEARAMLELETNVGQVETIVADLSDTSFANFNNIIRQINPNKRDIGVLINNVGMMPKPCAKFDQINLDSMITMISVNMIAMVQLTRAILPGMLGRQRGLIVNVSSPVGIMSLPYFSVYAPTKAFVDSLTRQLQMEYGSQPIDIVLLMPGPTLTCISGHDGMKLYKPSLLKASPDEYAESAISSQSAGINIYSGLMRHGLLKIVMLALYNLGMLKHVARLGRDMTNNLDSNLIQARGIGLAKSNTSENKNHSIVQFASK